jgi:hypothetical protein
VRHLLFREDWFFKSTRGRSAGFLRYSRTSNHLGRMELPLASGKEKLVLPSSVAGIFVIHLDESPMPRLEVEQALGFWIFLDSIHLKELSVGKKITLSKNHRPQDDARVEDPPSIGNDLMRS